MISLLADHNVIQQSQLIWKVFAEQDWRELGIAALLLFPDVGLDAAASDRDVWLACQRQSLLLLTANRNADGEDSLVAVIAELNYAAALPVVTIANAGRVREYSYREECAYRIADIAAEIERFYGTGRQFIP